MINLFTFHDRKKPTTWGDCEVATFHPMNCYYLPVGISNWRKPQQQRPLLFVASTIANHRKRDRLDVVWELAAAVVAAEREQRPNRRRTEVWMGKRN
jgi:hypothetical protein